MNRKKTEFFSAGLSSILLVFVLLCLITFAVLSLSSAKSDQQFSQKLADRTTEYYAAEAKIYQSLAEMDALLLEQYQADLENWPEAAGTVLEAAGYEVAEVTEGAAGTSADAEDAAQETVLRVTFRETVQESQDLTVICQIKDPETEEDGFYRILSWKTQNTEDWEADQTLPVLRREDSEE